MDIIENLEFKPILSTNMKLFDRVGQPFDAHPIIIFEHQNKVYFLKAQSATYVLDDNDKTVLDDDQQKAIQRNECYLVKSYDDEISNNQYDTFFRQDSLVDTTQLFVMNKDEFLEYFKFDNVLEKADFYTRSLLYTDRKIILKQLKNNLAKENVSITSISKRNANGVWFSPKLIYSAQKFIDRDERDALKNYNKGKYIELHKIREYKHNYTEYQKENNSTIKQYIKSLEDFVDSKFDDTIEKIADIKKNIGDLQFLQTLNSETKKYSETEVEERWWEDLALVDEQLNLSEYEKEYYKYHQEEYDKKFKTLCQELKEQQDIKKKDKDQEMSL